MKPEDELQCISHNLNRNRFWLYTGIEMLGLAFYFVWANRYFEFPPPAREILSVLDDPMPLLLIAAMAGYVLAWSIWNFHHFHAKQVAVGFAMAVMMIYFLAFLVRDLDLGQISLGTIFTGIVVLRVVHEAVVK
ncbi:hypothetical protein [Lacticaseibacillus salsurivasis]|uniref:hypothetical protein n=1 Tax=Lacticaseibacillus salsurivasis TaxID=3081441 RepID=UPI0030C6CFD9